MPDIKLIAAGGVESFLDNTNSVPLGQAFRAGPGIMTGTVFKPATKADRDALVAALQAISYETDLVDIVIEYNVPRQGVYRVRAQRTGTSADIGRWVQQEVHNIARRYGLTPEEADRLVSVTVTEIGE